MSLALINIKNFYYGINFEIVYFPAASAVAFFNSNPKVVLDILSPIIDDTAAAILKAFVNKILGSIPVNELLLDD